jgi:hypothetical protein
MKLKIVIYGFFLLIAALSCNEPIIEPVSIAQGQPIAPELKAVATTANFPHPRLLMNDSLLSSLKAQASSDGLLRRYVDDVIYNANKFASMATPVYSTSLLPVSQDCLNRILHLGVAYRWTGDLKYANAAKTLLLAICSFPDWHPSQFLDAAEMTNAAGIGYDWFYKSLDATSKTKIENAIIQLGINPYLALNQSNPAKIGSLDNWNLVCNSGCLIGALAVNEVYPDIALNVKNIAIKNLPIALRSYAPDGAWYEGTCYWRYATDYAMYGISALKSATGNDAGLSLIDGVSNAGNFPLYSIGPSGYQLNFADTYKGLYRADIPMNALFCLGKLYNNQFYINSEHKFLVGRRAEPGDVIYYAPQKTDTQAKSLDKLFNGIVPIAVFRNSWTDTQTLFVGAKAGSNDLAHCHLDLGNFEMEAFGVRWAYDLGADSYDLPGYWDRWQGGKRWSYYRMNSHSHNVLMINNKDQLVAGLAKVISFQSGTMPYISMDLTSAYTPDASKVIREIKLTNSRQTVQIFDEVTLAKQSDIYWGMTTPAAIQISSGGKATLTKDGKTLYATILSPAGAEFYSESCLQASPQQSNTGFSRLMIKVNKPVGITKVVVTLSTLP